MNSESCVNKPLSKNLAACLLASTLFMPQAGVADTVVDSAVTAINSYQSSIGGNLLITNKGEYLVDATAVQAVLLDQEASTLTCDPNNINVANPPACVVGRGIDAVVMTGKSTVFTLGTATSIYGYLHGLRIYGESALVNDNGLIRGVFAPAVEVIGDKVAMIVTSTNLPIPSIQSDFSSAVLVSGANFLLGNAGLITVLNTAGPVIDLQGVNTVIANSGTIAQPSIGQITIRVANTGITINNNAGGQITGKGNVIAVSQQGFTLNNVGNIISSGQQAILLSKSFNLITNSGTIVGGNISSAIELGAAVALGNITNSGTITSGAAGNGIYINKAGWGGTLNNTGTIQTNLLGGGISDAIKVNGNFGVINNSGTISGSDVLHTAIDVIAANTGIINNSGTIQAVNQSAIQIGANMQQINNTGLIQSTTAGTTVLRATAASVLSGGLHNSGDITAFGAGDAIDFSTVPNVNIPIFQTGGTITGDVLLSSVGGNALTMTGGTINGNVIAAPAGIGTTLNLAGGTITGTTSLGNNAGTVNLSGTTLQALNGGGGNDIFNVSGGSFTLLDGGLGFDTLNIISTYTLANPFQNIEALNVLNSGTLFTLNQSPNGAALQTITIGGPGTAGAAMQANANITATGLLMIANANSSLNINSNVTFNSVGAINNGTLTINPTGVLNTNGGNYVQNAPGAYVVPLGAPQPDPFIPLQAGGGNINLLAGTSIHPFILGTVFISEGTVFNIASTKAPGFINDLSTLVPSNQPIIFFEKSGPAGNVCTAGRCIQLIFHRNPYTIAATSAVGFSVAVALDNILPTTTDPTFRSLFANLDSLTSLYDVNAALETLAPAFNGSVAVNSHVSMDNAFESVQYRLEALRSLSHLSPISEHMNRDLLLYNGVEYNERVEEEAARERGRNYGDYDFDRFYYKSGTRATWAKLYGAVIDQHKRNEIEGYLAGAEGLAIGGDWRLTDATLFGLSGSVTTLSSKDNTVQADTVDIKSGQVTFYTWLEPIENVYIDAMIGLASHKYKTERNIIAGDFYRTATAKFYGLNYGAQVDAGYVFLSGDYYVVPFVRGKYTYLNIDNYSETGADALNLSVNNRALTEMIAGAGLRLALKRDYIEAVYVPEIDLMVAYDFSGQAQSMVTTFLGGGGSPFYINSIAPAQMIYMLGLGINAYTSDQYSFRVKGNLERRDEYFGYNAYMQLMYTWG